MIKYVPNILTSLRIISIPFIVILFTIGKIEWSIIIAVITAITDCFDGFIARKFNATSELGAKLDAVSDKFFAIGLLITLSIRYHLLFINLGLEIIIAIINLYLYYKTKITRSLYIGKIKTWFLFLTVILGFASCFSDQFKLSMNVMLIITIILQIFSIINYIVKYISEKKVKMA